MLTSHIEASCSGKRDYRTFWRAYRAAKYINRNRDNARCQTYRCDNCSHWHVGNGMRKSNIRELGAAV